MKNIIKKYIYKRKKILKFVRFIIYPFREFYKFFLFNFSIYKCFKLSRRKNLKIELGSGAKYGQNGWITIDLVKGADIFWDLRKGIPFRSNSVDVIYSSHLLEHISSKDLDTFLVECLRVLKKDGSFLVCVPNARNYIDAYINKEKFRKNDNYWQPAKVDTGSFLDQLNYIAYMDGQHKYMFDQENLINILIKSGFKSAKIRSFDPNLDLIERDYESIYAFGVK